jgi:phosphoglycolate phosphatase
MSVGARLALFDLDGTLIDSAPDLAAAVDYALGRNGLPPRGIAQVRDFIGDGAARLVHRAVTGRHDGTADESLFASVYAEFQQAYAARLFQESTVYPGVFDALNGLRARGWLIGCVTNKPARFTLPLLAAAGLAAYFSVVVSGDSLAARKPDPAPLLHAAEMLGVAPGATIMIGDSLIDVRAARNAGIPIYCVRGGYHGGADLAAAGACAMLDGLHDLLPLLEPAAG